MSLNFCDLLVLGGDLSGVMAATMLAKRGMNVLVLDDDETASPLLPNVVTGLGSKNFKSLLGKLMIPDSKLQILHENKIGCQVVFPRHRLDLHKTRPQYLKEIAREFPEEKETFEELLAEADKLRESHLDELLSLFPISQDKDKKRFGKWMENFPSDHLLSLWNKLSPTFQCLLKTQIRFFSQSPIMEPIFLQLLLFLPPENLNSYSIRGGLQELKKLFYDKLDYFGSMVHPVGPENIEMVHKGREMKSLQMQRYNFPTRFRYLLGNSNIQELYESLPNPLFSFLFRSPKKKIQALQPIEEKHVVQYHLSRDILPEPMKENLILVSDPLAPLQGTNYLELNLSPLPKALSENEDTLLTVSYVLSGDFFSNPAASLQQGSLEQIHDEIDQKLHKLIPFAQGKILRVSSEKFAENDTPLFPSASNPSTFGKVLNKKVTYKPSLFFPTQTSPFKNLFVVGPNVLDWLGMEGKMLSALKAVDSVWNQELKIREK